MKPFLSSSEEGIKDLTTAVQDAIILQFYSGE
jgi:hypothetical protein